MQDRYVGDIGDFGKYGLLRHLARRELSLGVVWGLNNNVEANNHGQFVKYLMGDPWGLRQCDPELYDTLKELVEGGDRNVRAIRDRGVLPEGTAFFEEPLGPPETGSARAKDERLAWRRRWREAALATTKRADIVFFDPDNGLAGKSVSVRSKAAQKYIFIDELAPYIERGQSVVVYQHATRQKGGIEATVAGWLSRFGDAIRPASAWAMTYHRQQARIYFVLSSATHRRTLEECSRELVAGPWGRGGHFRLRALV